MRKTRITVRSNLDNPFSTSEKSIQNRSMSTGGLALALIAGGVGFVRPGQCPSGVTFRLMRLNPSAVFVALVAVMCPDCACGSERAVAGVVLRDDGHRWRR